METGSHVLWDKHHLQFEPQCDTYDDTTFQMPLISHKEVKEGYKDIDIEQEKKRKKQGIII